MKVLIMGAGRMGSWLAGLLHRDHEVAVHDTDGKKLECLRGIRRFPSLPPVGPFEPDLVINAVSLPKTAKAFDAVRPFLPKTCLLSDIASVKTGLADLYQEMGHPFVSTHPMFGPTFADVRDIEGENAIIIRESHEQGRRFFRHLYGNLGLNVYEYTFEEHDRTIAYSLSVPFASSIVFAACMKKQAAPGTTFRKHLAIARGLFSEDDHLLAEILFNPFSLRQIEEVHSKLYYLTHIIRGRDYEEMAKWLKRLRENVS